LPDRAFKAAARVAEATAGVTPVGHPELLRTISDIALSNYDIVWAAGGTSAYVGT
jgi:prolyl-tRNA editing enzyme YbaK/EbsC (Cys-tRNA(Pro) deacylase)